MCIEHIHRYRCSHLQLDYQLCYLAPLHPQHHIPDPQSCVNFYWQNHHLTDPCSSCFEASEARQKAAARSRCSTPAKREVEPSVPSKERHEPEREHYDPQKTAKKMNLVLDPISRRHARKRSLSPRSLHFQHLYRTDLTEHHSAALHNTSGYPTPPDIDIAPRIEGRLIKTTKLPPAPIAPGSNLSKLITHVNAPESKDYFAVPRGALADTYHSPASASTSALAMPPRIYGGHVPARHLVSGVEADLENAHAAHLALQIVVGGINDASDAFREEVRGVSGTGRVRGNGNGYRNGNGNGNGLPAGGADAERAQGGEGPVVAGRTPEEAREMARSGEGLLAVEMGMEMEGVESSLDVEVNASASASASAETVWQNELELDEQTYGRDFPFSLLGFPNRSPGGFDDEFGWMVDARAAHDERWAFNHDLGAAIMGGC